MFALIFTRKLRPMIIGSISGWLMFAGMIARAARHLVADELGRDHSRNGRAERLARMLTRQQFRHLRAGRTGVRQARDVGLALQVLADRDVFHLGRHDAGARVMHLGDVPAGLRAFRQPVQVEAQLRELRIGEPLLAVARRRTRQFLGVAALGDPRGAQRRQAGADVDRRLRIGVRALVS